MVVVKLSLRYAFKNNIINSFDLTVKFPKNNCDLLPTTFNKYDLNKLIKYLQQNITSFNLGLLLVIFSGLRIGEICALKYSDFNIKKKTFTVDKTLQRIYTSQTKSKIIISSPKTSSSIREVPINDVLLQIIKTLKYNKDDYIISKKTKPTEPRVLRSRFNTILKKLKISPIKFHALRHTFATKCIENNIDYKTISVILGHSSINTTLNLYVHPNLQQKKKAINKLSKLLLT
jgi:integrase